MLVPVLIGAIIAIVSFLPLAFSIKLSKKVTPTSNLGYGSITLLAVFLSMAVLLISVLVCFFCFRDYVVAFALSCAITLVVLAIAFGIYITVSRKKFKNSTDLKNDGAQSENKQYNNRDQTKL